ncbi:MAG: amino acid permease [Pseudomonadota bacterium]
MASDAPHNHRQSTALDADTEQLRHMGYEQELSRRMGGFSSFAVSFARICVLAGGITAFSVALGAGGGFALGVGWPIGCLFALIVAAAISQIASAYPTAGGVYHWGAILGGKGWGWATAWFNLFGVVFALASINFGLYEVFFKAPLGTLLGADTSAWGWGVQTAFIVIVTALQAWLNHAAPRLTTLLTDLSGGLIFFLTVLLITALLWYSPSVDFSRAFMFENFTGAPGSTWPESDNLAIVFLLGLLLTLYTICGYEGAANAAEETHDAQRAVPRGILGAVLWSSLFGYGLVVTFVAVMPSVEGGVSLGMGVFDAILAPLPTALRVFLLLGLFYVNFVCALAAMTSASRMIYAFARDGGLPWSGQLQRVSATCRTPMIAVWACALMAIVATLYGDAFVVLSTASAVFLYISYVMPTAAGLLAEGRSWVHKGPLDLGALSKPVAALAVLGGAILIFVGAQPPNEKVLYVTIALVVILNLSWWCGVRARFAGPPTMTHEFALRGQAAS